MSLAAIRIGNNVTIGATAEEMAGVAIGDAAIVSAGAVVSKGSRIGPGEVRSGMLAKPLGAEEHWDTGEPDGSGMCRKVLHTCCLRTHRFSL